MRKLFVILALVVIAAVVHFGPRLRDSHSSSGRSGGVETTSAPVLSLRDLKGNSVETATYKGNVVLVNFWAAWCTPCAEEVPQIMALQDRYREQGLRVIGVSMEDTDTALREFYAKYKMNYPVVPGNAKVAEAYGGILGLPTTILISRDGQIKAKYPGLIDFGKLEPEIVALLGGS